ncbi:MAG: hypothetical protein DBX47_06660 [Clostridiales bacterium]|nr:MAG: hypothetical protein DBX47_06660 [Clostridiales bacterium]
MKMTKTKLFIRIFLLLVLVATVAGFVMMRADIATENKKIAEIKHSISEQKLRNEELSSVLEPENTDDFYKDIAESDLDYGYANEKIYVDISGK